MLNSADLQTLSLTESKINELIHKFRGNEQMRIALLEELREAGLDAALHERQYPHDMGAYIAFAGGFTIDRFEKIYTVSVYCNGSRNQACYRSAASLVAALPAYLSAVQGV
jgi:hypothetical protein